MKLSSSDLQWIDVYEVGDTLIFRSDKGEFDSSLIVKKEVFYGDYNPIESSENISQWGIVWYKNKRLEYDPEGHRLVTIFKQNKRTAVLRVNYQYGATFGIDVPSDSLSNVKKGSLYKFDTFHPRGDPWQPKTIFWDEMHGLVKYITHDNTVWERINLPK